MKTCYTLKVEGTARPAIADLTEMNVSLFEINRINVPGVARGKGHGSALLREICADADSEGVVLTLGVASSGPLDNTDLARWYARYGFVGGITEMRREPQRNAT